MSEMVKKVAASIRTEIDILLGDYTGDLCNGIERTPEEQALAESRLEALDWLRETWRPDATASEERLEGVARAAIEAMRDPGRDFIWAAARRIKTSDCGGQTAEELYQAVIDAILNPSQT